MLRASKFGHAAEYNKRENYKSFELHGINRGYSSDELIFRLRGLISS